MYRCKCTDGVVRYVEFIYMKRAWVAAITACKHGYHPFTRVEDNDPSEEEPPIETPEDIEDVTGLALSYSNGEMNVSWTPNDNYLTEVSYRLDNGEWITLPLIEAGVGEI